MGYAECNITMESSTGSVSPYARNLAGGRGQTEKSSPFCHGSSSKLTQSIIKDHMVSHYKKVFSAKSTIDNSKPISMQRSVKYKDQVRKEQIRKFGRPQSAHSILQRSNAASCSSIESRTTEQNDESLLFLSRSSSVSSPRFSTSFNPNDTVYSAHKGSSHRPQSASERKYSSPVAAPPRKQSTCSLDGSKEQGSGRSFQDPVQKTYSGDLLRKHSQHFTQDKPFTPKTLKSDKTPYLLKYRYYRSPKTKPTRHCNPSAKKQENTYRNSTKDKEDTQDYDEPSEICCSEDGWSDSEVDQTFLSSLRQKSQPTRRDGHYYFRSSSRNLPEGERSANHGTPEEEELLYLEFISAVTEDILSRGHISDRVLNQVMRKHIDMNLHQLDEGKMRHLLEILRKEFEEPLDTSTSGEKEDYLDAIFSNLQLEGSKPKPKRDDDPFSDASPIDINFPKYTNAFLISTPIRTPERANSASPSENNTESSNEQNTTDTLSVTEMIGDNSASGDMDFPQDNTGTNDADDDGYSLRNNDSDHSDNASIHLDEQSNEFEDQEESLSEPLQISSNEHSDEEEAAVDHPLPTVASLSDDEF